MILRDPFPSGTSFLRHPVANVAITTITVTAAINEGLKLLPFLGGGSLLLKFDDTQFKRGELRRPLRKKEIKRLRSELITKFPEEFIELILSEQVSIEKLSRERSIIYSGKTPCIVIERELVYPTLFFSEESGLKTVVVDMGAVGPVSRGSDVMIPGIVKLDQFKEGEVLQIKDEKHHVSIAVGVSLMSSDEVKRRDRGRCIRNLHWVGDEIWRRGAGH